MVHDFGGLVLGIAIGIVIAWLYFLVWKVRYSSAIREDAVQRSLAVTAGKVHEQLVPYLPEFGEIGDELLVHLAGRDRQAALHGVLTNRGAVADLPDEEIEPRDDDADRDAEDETAEIVNHDWKDATLRADALLPALQLRLGACRQTEGSGQQEHEDEEQRREQPRSPGSDRGSKPREPERRSQHDDGIEAGALPVIAVEMQPHPELVEREPETDPVERGGRRSSRAGAE